MKTTLTIFLLLFSTLLFGQSKEEYKKIGDSLMSAGLADEALKYFGKELKTHPKNEDILRWLGFIYLTKDSLDLGEKYYLQALVVNPKCATCLLNIGKVTTNRGDFKKALLLFDSAVRIEPQNAALYADRARLKYMMDDVYQASRDINKAIELAPDNVDFYMQRGSYQIDLGYNALAIDDYTKAISIDPKNYNFYYRRADAKFRDDQLQDALTDINKAIQLDSNQYELYGSRGALYDALQDHSAAIADYTKAIALSKGKDYLSYIHRGKSHYLLEDMDATCADYAILEKRIKDGSITNQSIIDDVNGTIDDICISSNASYYYQRGVGWFNLKQYQKAIDIYDQGLAIFKNHGTMLSFKANALLSLNKFEEAISTYELALQHRDNLLAEIKSNRRFASATNEDITHFFHASIATIYISISECQLNLGAVNEALRYADKAIEMGPDVAGNNKEAFYNGRGYIYVLMGKYGLALEDLNNSIKWNKDYPVAYVNRAIAKVSMVDKVKTTTMSVSSSVYNQPMNVRWTLPNKTTVNKSQSNILSALSDCNKAVELDPKSGYAYYIRGQIKQMLQYDDYCLDLLAAQQFGITVAPELLIKCSK